MPAKEHHKTREKRLRDEEKEELQRLREEIAKIHARKADEEAVKAGGTPVTIADCVASQDDGETASDEFIDNLRRSGQMLPLQGPVKDNMLPSAEDLPAMSTRLGDMTPGYADALLATFGKEKCAEQYKGREHLLPKHVQIAIK